MVFVVGGRFYFGGVVKYSTCTTVVDASSSNIVYMITSNQGRVHENKQQTALKELLEP